jgi:hypothetical protein
MLIIAKQGIIRVRALHRSQGFHWGYNLLKLYNFTFQGLSVTFQLLLSNSLVYKRELLSKHDPLYKFLALFHKSIGEKGAIDTIVAPTSNSITHSCSDLCEEVSILTGSFRILWNLVSFTNENELIIFHFKRSWIVSAELGVMRGWLDWSFALWGHFLTLTLPSLLICYC